MSIIMYHQAKHLQKSAATIKAIRRQRRVVGFALFFLFYLYGFPGCSEVADPPGMRQEPVEETAEKALEEAKSKENAVLEDGDFVIGVLQFTEHQALNDAWSGILDAMNAEGLAQDENLTVKYKNALGSVNACQTIAKHFAQDDVDLIIALATPAVQAAAEAAYSRDIPVVFAAVTEPQAAGVVNDWQKPGTQVTGVSDLTPVWALMEMALEIMPDTQNIGVVYNDEEVNSVIQVDLSKEAATALDVNVVESVARKRAEITPAAEALIGKVDVIWIPTDNLILEAFDSIYRVMENSQIPVIGASTQFAAQGALCATGFEYYDLGFQAGIMVAEILRGADPAVTPVQQPTDILIAINLKAAENIGYHIPFEFLLMADELYFEVEREQPYTKIRK